MGNGSSFIEDPGEDIFEELDLKKLEIDEAFLRVKSNVSPFYLYTKSGDCYNCTYQLFEEEDLSNITLKTHHPWNFILTSNKNSTYPFEADLQDSMLCDPSRDISLGEFGVYDLILEDGQCNIKTAKEPVFEYGALIIALLVYIGIIILVEGFYFAKQKGVFNKLFGKNEQVDLEQQTKKGNGQESPPATKKVRIKSLDTFRGISIVLMIFVNYGAGLYWFMEHATWNGLQVADLVFPWFMWIMGVCIPMGLKSQIKRKVPKHLIFFRILKRSLKLFGLGIILNSLGGNINFETCRIPGVLQRFGIAYLVTSTVALFLARDPNKEYKSKWLMYIQDILYLLPQWIFYLILIAIHTCIIFLLPVDGCPTGYLGPGGIALMQDNEPSPECIGGATRLVDTWLLGKSHMYQHPTAKYTYSASAFDPEGVLGSMTSIFQVFLGVQAGYIMQFFQDHGSRLRRWLLWAVMTGAIGFILCFGTMNDGPIPINKNLWSLSYVMVTSCFAFVLLSVCYYIIDVANWYSGSPFYQAGMNGILLYVGHNVAYNIFPWHYEAGRMNTHIELLTESCWGTSLWVIIALYLHHKGKFYTV